jgi:hypothetical protein
VLIGVAGANYYAPAAAAAFVTQDRDLLLPLRASTPPWKSREGREIPTFPPAPNQTSTFALTGQPIAA